MIPTTIDHTTLSKLAEAGLVRSAHAVGQAGGWSIRVRDDMSERALATSHGRQVRIFRKLETLANYLKEVGIPRFDVDAVNYDPRDAAADRAVALKDARQDAAYTKWLKAEIQEAIDDTSPTISHEEAMRLIRGAIKQA